MTKTQLHQGLFRQYKVERGTDAVSTRQVVIWAVGRGYLKKPEPIDPYTMLADDFAKSLRDEIRHDGKTGRPYRVNHAVAGSKNGKKETLWGDIDEQPRAFMQKSFMQRREQIVGDCVQLTFDCDHFNDRHPDEEPIIVPVDFTDDVTERKHVRGERDVA